VGHDSCLALYKWVLSTRGEKITDALPSDSGKKVTPKLTEKQRHAVELLQTAVAEAAGLEPDMRSFVLWHAALGIES
jgi:hypothetical protein